MNLTAFYSLKDRHPKVSEINCIMWQLFVTLDQWNTNEPDQDTEWTRGTDIWLSVHTEPEPITASTVKRSTVTDHESVHDWRNIFIWPIFEKWQRLSSVSLWWVRLNSWTTPRYGRDAQQRCCRLRFRNRKILRITFTLVEVVEQKQHMKAYGSLHNTRCGLGPEWLAAHSGCGPESLRSPGPKHALVLPGFFGFVFSPPDCLALLSADTQHSVIFNIITFLLIINLHITNIAGGNLHNYKMSKMTSDRFLYHLMLCCFFVFFVYMWKDVKDSHSLMIIVTAPDSYSMKTVAVLIPAEQEGCSSLFHPHAPGRFFSPLQDLHAGECHHGAVSSCCLHSGVEGNGSSHPQLSINLVYKWSKWNG